MNEVLKVIKERGSLRGYKDKKITQEAIDLIIESAMRAPTAGNMMLYSIIVVKSNVIKEKLAVSCDNQPFIAKAPALLIFLADYSKWYKYYEQNNVEEFLKGKGEKLEGPTEANLILATEDALVAAQNAVIAAESLGIGSCYIGDIMEKVEYHRQLLKLPKYVFPVVMLTLGYYPDNYHVPLKTRFNKEYVVFEDEYRELSKEEINAMYKERDSLYIEENKYGANNYAQMHYSFKTKAEFSKEMTRSVKEELKNWK